MRGALRRSAALLAGLVGLVAAAAPAGGQNLAGNGELDETTAGWYLLGTGTLDWDSADHDNCFASGSAAITNADPGLFDVYQIQCAPGVVPGQAHSFGADFNFPSGQAVSGSAQIELRFYPDLNCTDSALLLAASPPVYSSAPSIWQRSANLAAVAPPESLAGQIAIVVHKEAAGPLIALVDGVFLVPGAGRLFADGFGAGATCRWSAAIPLLEEDL